MTGELFINGKDAYTEYGMSLEDGAISALLTPPSLKEFVENESRIENGKKIIVSYPVYDARDVSLAFHIVAPTKEAFFAKYQALCAVLQKGIVKIKTKYQADTVYKFVYNSCTQFSQYSFGIAKFTLKLTEANPADRTGELYSEGVIPGNSEGTSHEGVDMVELAKAIEDLQKEKLDKTAVKAVTGASTTDTMSQKAITEELAKKQGTLKAGTGISIVNGVVNNTAPAPTVAQTTGTSTSSVMSQDAATKNFAVGKDIGQPTCVYLSAVNSIELSDKQVELLEARDVISVEICISNLNRDNNYNKTIAPKYFSIILGDKSLGSAIKCRFDGVPDYRGCGVTNRPFNWQNLVHGITIPCGYDRWIMVLDRKKGRIALYDRPGSLIQEETDETLFKSDSWFGGVKSLSLSADYANLFGLRIYDHDISVIHKADNQSSEQEVFGENLLPYHYPRYYNDSINRQDIIYDKDHWLINSVSKYPRPYHFGVFSKMYKDDEGLHMISDKEYASNDSTTMFACATYAEPTYDLSVKSVFIVTFRVVTGSVRTNTNGFATENYLVGSGITDTDGNVYTTSDILGPGTYTMEFMASLMSIFCSAAEANTEIVLIKTEIYLPRLVISLDFHTVFKNKVYDAVWDKWYESKATDGYPTNVVSWKFSNEKYDALSPNTLSKPGRRGDMKIDTNGDVYIGVVNGPTQVWKKINNA